MADRDHKEILELFDHDWRADGDNRDDALEDLKFMAGDQWANSERQSRQADGRPCLTVNRMPQFVNQIANDIRQARPAIHCMPVDSMTDPVLSEIFEGAIRQIEYRSYAHFAYSQGVEDAISCGIGHWRLETEFNNDSTFDQDIKIKAMLDPLSVVWDSAAIDLVRSDARHCFITDMISREDFEERWGQRREPVEWPDDVNRRTSAGQLFWQDDDNRIRIAEYWYKKPEKRRLILTQDGATIDVTDADDQMVAMMGPVRERFVTRDRIFRQMVDGADFLGDPEEWAGSHIPIIPVLGAQKAFDGSTKRWGLVRMAKDAQRLYNLWRSAGAEVIAKSPKAPWLVTFGMIEGLEGYWSNANKSNLPFLPYKPDPTAPGAAPLRQDPPTAPAAMWQEAALAADDMKATTGIFDAALGARSNETSGRAILARDRQGDTANLHFSDNFKASMQRTGELLVDLIPKIYDSDRIIRILGPKDEEQFVPINHVIMSEDGLPVMVNDLSHARFDVRIEMGPSYTTARVEARELLIDAVKSNPELWGVIGDLIFKHSDAEGADEIAERLRKTMPPEITGEDSAQGQQQSPMDDPIAQAAMQMEFQEKLADIALKEAKAQKEALEAQHTAAETDKTEAEAKGVEIDNIAKAGQFGVLP